MTIQISGASYHIRIGKLDEAVLKEVDLAELDEHSFAEEVGSWIAVNELLDIKAPNSDVCYFERDGEEIQISEDADAEELGSEYLPNDWDLADEETKFILVSIQYLQGIFGSLITEANELDLCAEAPEFGGEEFCMYTHVTADGKRLTVDESNQELRVNRTRHLIIDLESEEVVAEFDSSQ